MQPISSPLNPSPHSQSIRFGWGHKEPRPEIPITREDIKVVTDGIAQIAAQGANQGSLTGILSNVAKSFGPLQVLNQLFSIGGQVYITKLEANQYMSGYYDILKGKDLSDVGFDQIVGHEQIKKDLKTYLERQKFQNVYDNLFKDDPRGLNNYILLTGPPGTGKTMLAKAVASNLDDAVFVNLNCDNLIQLRSGTGAKNIAKLEKKLSKLPEKRIILFMDEIDSLGNRMIAESSDEYKTLTRLLKMLDGVNGLNGKELLVIGATNRPELLDEALVNRFRQIVEVPPPTADERKTMIEMYLDSKSLIASEDLDLDAAVEATEGFTGRKIEQAISTLKSRCIQSLSDEEKEALNTELQQLSKQKKKKGEVIEPPKIELRFTQDELMQAIDSATDKTKAKPLELAA